MPDKCCEDDDMFIGGDVSINYPPGTQPPSIVVAPAEPSQPNQPQPTQPQFRRPWFGRLAKLAIGAALMATGGGIAAGIPFVLNALRPSPVIVNPPQPPPSESPWKYMWRFPE